jgi:hypothetical protein
MYAWIIIALGLKFIMSVATKIIVVYTALFHCHVGFSIAIVELFTIQEIEGFIRIRVAYNV